MTNFERYSVMIEPTGAPTIELFFDTRAEADEFVRNSGPLAQAIECHLAVLTPCI